MGAQESYLVKSIADVQTRTRQSFEIPNLDTAISLLREAILLQPELDVKRSASLSSLAVALLTRFNMTSQLQDLDEAISLFNEALELPHEDRLDLLNNLCAALLTRFHATTEPQHFEAGVMRRVEVLRLEAAAMGIPDHVFYVRADDEYFSELKTQT
jgi:tetratricopeptide (TPR) repeat protein